MGDLQSLVCNRFFVVEKDIEIDVSRSFVDELNSAHAILYRLELIE